MTIIELIKKVGVENVEFQHLDESVVGTQVVAKPKGRGLVRVTFITHKMTVADAIKPGENIGLVLWMPRKLWEKAIKDL